MSSHRWGFGFMMMVWVRGEVFRGRGSIELWLTFTKRMYFIFFHLGVDFKLLLKIR